MKKIVILLLMVSTYALASETGHEGTDILQRTVNFLLFAGLLWYLVAQPVKNFFTSRSNSIAEELNKVQEKLQESIVAKKEALAKISEAEKFAEELAATSKKENKILNDKIMEQCEKDLENLVKQYDVKKEFAQRTMVRNVVEEIVGKTLDESSEIFDKEAMANVIIKKVA